MAVLSHATSLCPVDSSYAWLSQSFSIPAIPGGDVLSRA